MVGLVLLVFCSLIGSVNPTELRNHVADTLKIKCNALLYRSWLIDRTCYFAIISAKTLTQSRSACSFSLNGAELTKPQVTVIQKLFLDVSDFHRPTDSASEDKKYALCSYELPQVCNSGELSPLPGGKCMIRATQKMTYPNAVKFCASKSAHLPVLNNALEKNALTGMLRSDPIWLGVTASGQGWSDNNEYAWHTTCKDGSRDPPRDRKSFCNADFAEILDPQGHTSISEQSNLMDVICVNDASSDLFTPPVVLTTTSTTTTTTTAATTTTTAAVAKAEKNCDPNISGVWTEWAPVSSEPCPTTCGSCSLVARKRECTNPCGSCNCVGKDTDIGPCGTTMCTFPAGGTCCGAFKKSINYHTARPYFFCGLDSVPPQGECGKKMAIPTHPPSQCHNGGMWLEWAPIGTCPTTCGSCSKMQRKRECNLKWNGCLCNNQTTQTGFGPCGTALCKFPQKTCCAPYKKSSNGYNYWGVGQPYLCATRDLILNTGWPTDDITD